MGEFRKGDSFGYAGPNGGLVLNESGAKILNNFRKELLRLGNIRTVAPVGFDNERARKFSLDTLAPIYVKLTDPGSGHYTFVEQRWNGTAWEPVPGGLTGDNIWEANLTAGLDGKVVRVYWNADSGTWRFQWQRIQGATCNPPTLNSFGPATICADTTQTFGFSGVSDGNSGTALPIVVTGTSSNTAIVSSVTITYTSANVSGTMALAYGGGVGTFGTSTISIKVANACGSMVVKTFVATWRDDRNTPTLDPIANVHCAAGGFVDVPLTGIGVNPAYPGATITVTAASSNPGLFSNGTITYTSPNSTGTCRVNAAPASSGTGTMTVTVTTNHPVGFSECGLNFKNQPFTVTVP